MADSRKYEVNFNVAAMKITLGIGDSGKKLFSGVSINNSTSRVNIGVPSTGTAYCIQHNSGAGYWYFVGSNPLSAYNDFGPYPDGSADYDRTPCTVTWYDGDSTAILTQSGSGFSYRDIVVNSRTVRYSMFVSRQYQTVVNNTTSEEITVYKRTLGTPAFTTTGDSIGLITPGVTSWTDVTIAANSSKTIIGYEPLSIKFDEDTIDADIYGVKRQDGKKFLIVGAD